MSAARPSRARETDVVARLGGDEFALLLIGAGEEEGRRFSEELLTRIRGLRALSGGRAKPHPDAWLAGYHPSFLVRAALAVVAALVGYRGLRPSTNADSDLDVTEEALELSCA